MELFVNVESEICRLASLAIAPPWLDVVWFLSKVDPNISPSPLK